MIAVDDVTLSTKCWEGDYRTVLDPEVWRARGAPWGRVGRRQVVLNRIVDRSAAEAMAAVLQEEGLLDDVAWAEDRWPAGPAPGAFLR